MPFPHPRKIFRAVRFFFALAFLAIGIAGMVFVFYSAIIPQEIVSLVPSELYSVSRINIILIASFFFFIIGLVLLLKNDKK